jgi:hypothetical protein
MSARAPGPSIEADAVVFELERFELVGERLEVGGRWTGIRGRRFLRPTLTAIVDGTEHRALAVLEHKPWAAHEGTDWKAAFPWQADAPAPTAAELAVAPDISISLPDPSAPGAAPPVPAPGRPEGSAGPRRATRLRAQSGGDRPPYVRASAAPHSAPLRRAEQQALLRALADERAETARLRSGLERAAAAETEAASAIGRRDAALSRLEEVIAERDAALAARAQVVAESDELALERDRLRAERDSAVAAREAELERRHEATESAVDARLTDLRAEVQREWAAASRMAHAVDERDVAREALERAKRERDAACRVRDELRRERNRLLAERDHAQSEVSEVTRRWEAASAQVMRLTQARPEPETAAGGLAGGDPSAEGSPAAVRPAPRGGLASAVGGLASALTGHSTPPPGAAPTSGRRTARMQGLQHNRLARAVAVSALVLALVVLIIVLRTA